MSEGQAQYHEPFFSSPTISVTKAEMAVSGAPQEYLDGSAVLLPGYGVHNRKWLGTHLKYTFDSEGNRVGALIQVRSTGNTLRPYLSNIEVRDTCKLEYRFVVDKNVGFCTNSSDSTKYAFTSFNANDIDPNNSHAVTTNLWFMDTYLPDASKPNEILAFVHEERAGGYTPVVPPGAHEGHTRIGLAWSTNSGANWKYLGRIITPGGDESVNIHGAPYLIVGNDFYVYFGDKDTSGASQIGFAKAPIADVISAAKAGNVGNDLWKKGSAVVDGAGNVTGFQYTESAMHGYGHGIVYGQSSTEIWGVSHTQAMKVITGAGAYQQVKYYLPVTYMTWGDAENTEVRLLESTDGERWVDFKFLDKAPKATQGSGPAGYQYCTTHNYPGSNNKVSSGRFYVSCLKMSKEVPEGVPAYKAIYRWEVDVTKRSISSPKRMHKQKEDFDSTHTNNDWRYQYGDGVSIYDMSYSPASGVWADPSGEAKISENAMHPGSSADAILKWIAPRDGRVLIRAVIRDADPESCGSGGDGVFGQVIHKHNNGANQNMLFYDYVENGDTVGKGVNRWVYSLKTGDEILFVVKKAGNHYCDSTFWNPSIEFL